MTAKHKHHSNNIPPEEGDALRDEKLFDFDKNFGDEGDGDESNGPETGEQQDETQSALSELKEKHLRLLAEFDNYKKRTSRERYELMSTASKTVILSLLPVLDDFERALKSSETFQDDSFSEGVRMIYNRLLSVLQAQGLKAMESTGETFDADLHEAITDIPIDDPSKKGKVIDTVEKGYLLNDKIIRHAKVVVGK